MRRGSTKRFKGLSKSIRVHSFKGCVRHTEILHARDQARRRKEMAERRATEVRLLSAEDQDLVKRMWKDQGIDFEQDDPVLTAHCNEQGGMRTSGGN